MEAMTVIIEKTSTGFSAYVKEVDGLTTVGESLGEVKRNMYEVINDHLDYLKEHGEEVPPVTDLKIEFVIDLEQFFDYYNVINKSAFAEYAGINKSLFRQYTKGLAPISGKKVKKISDGLQRLADDLKDLTLV